MTLFDSIKYPIGLPPTYEQLKALPENIYNHWINNYTVDWHTQQEETCNVDNVVYWMNKYYDAACRARYGAEIEQDILSLRKVIQDWEEPE